VWRGTVWPRVSPACVFNAARIDAAAGRRGATRGDVIVIDRQQPRKFPGAPSVRRAVAAALSQEWELPSRRSARSAVANGIATEDR